MPHKFEVHQNKFEITGVEHDPSTPISSIEPIEEGGLAVENREDLIKVVESPLLKACEVLFDKGIQTVFSSANKKDVSLGKGHIAIDYESLNEANKKIALEIGELGIIHGSTPRQGVYIKIPINKQSTLGEISEQALELVSRFEDQETHTQFPDLL